MTAPSPHSRKLDLLWQITKRDLATRYRGSILGVLWTLITPIFMLAIYTFVFGVVFQARWGVATQNKLDFALILFCGLTTFNIFADTINRSPQVIVGNPNFVKKVLFPLELLPLSLLGSALFTGVVGIFILVIANLIIGSGVHPTLILYPLVLFPLILLTMGLAWFVAALGVYLRDISQIIPLLVTGLLFMSPVFYPISMLPQGLQPIYQLNPLTSVVENARRVVLWGELPDWTSLLIGTAVGAIVCILGRFWFDKTRKGFADVI